MWEDGSPTPLTTSSRPNVTSKTSIGSHTSQVTPLYRRQHIGRVRPAGQGEARDAGGDVDEKGHAGDARVRAGGHGFSAGSTMRSRVTALPSRARRTARPHGCG